MALFKNPFGSDAASEAKAKALWERAHKYFEGKLFNRAITDLQDALQLNPGYAKEAHELMQTLSGQGQDEQAVSIGTALLKINPTDHELLNRLGNSLRRLGDFPRARGAYTEALKQRQGFAFARYNLAACSFGIVTADADLVKQTQIVEPLVKPRRYDFLGNRAGSLPLGNQEFALPEGAKPAPAPGGAKPDGEALRLALMQEVQRAPGNWLAEYNLGLLQDVLGDGDEALKNLKQAYSHEPNHPAPINNLAVAILERTNHLEAAETLLTKALHKHPYERTIVLNLAIVSKRASKAFQVLKHYVYLGELLAKSQGLFEFEKFVALADDLYDRRKYVEAAPVFEQLAREQPGTVLFEKLAAIYQAQKRNDLYLGALARLVKYDPANKEARQRITDAAKAYEDEAHEKMVKGGKSQAASLLQKAVEIEETPDRWVELAQLYEDLGEEILAGNALRRWKELTVKPAAPAAPAASGKGP